MRQHEPPRARLLRPVKNEIEIDRPRLVRSPPAASHRILDLEQLPEQPARRRPRQTDDDEIEELGISGIAVKGSRGKKRAETNKTNPTREQVDCAAQVMKAISEITSEGDRDRDAVSGVCDDFSELMRSEQ